MASVLVLKNSSVAGNVPLADSLIEAEPALNTADKKLFSKDAAGNVFEIGVPMSPNMKIPIIYLKSQVIMIFE